MKGCLKLTSRPPSPGHDMPAGLSAPPSPGPLTPSWSFRKCVAFAQEIAEEIHIADEWDRTPTEPTRKLTYQDLLELKEIQRSLPHADQPGDPLTGKPAKHYLSAVPIGLLPLLAESSDDSCQSSRNNSSSPSPVTSPRASSPSPSPSMDMESFGAPAQSAPVSPWVMNFQRAKPPPPRAPPMSAFRAPPHLAHLLPSRGVVGGEGGGKPRFPFLPLLDTPPSSAGHTPFPSNPPSRTPSPPLSTSTSTSTLTSMSVSISISTLRMREPVDTEPPDEHERGDEHEDLTSDTDQSSTSLDPPTPSLTNASLDSSPHSRASSCSPEPPFFQLPPSGGYGYGYVHKAQTQAQGVYGQGGYVNKANGYGNARPGRGGDSYFPPQPQDDVLGHLPALGYPHLRGHIVPGSSSSSHHSSSHSHHSHHSSSLGHHTSHHHPSSAAAQAAAAKLRLHAIPSPTLLPPSPLALEVPLAMASVVGMTGTGKTGKPRKKRNFIVVNDIEIDLDDDDDDEGEADDDPENGVEGAGGEEVVAVVQEVVLEKKVVIAGETKVEDVTDVLKQVNVLLERDPRTRRGSRDDSCSPTEVSPLEAQSGLGEGRKGMVQDEDEMVKLESAWSDPSGGGEGEGKGVRVARTPTPSSPLMVGVSKAEEDLRTPLVSPHTHTQTLSPHSQKLTQQTRTLTPTAQTQAQAQGQTLNASLNLHMPIMFKRASGSGGRGTPVVSMGAGAGVR